MVGANSYFYKQSDVAIKIQLIIIMWTAHSGKWLDGTTDLSQFYIYYYVLRSILILMSMTDTEIHCSGDDCVKVSFGYINILCNN